MRRLYEREFDDDHLNAMERFRRCLRRGNVQEAREWLNVAERVCRMRKSMCDMVNESEKSDEREAGRPYRLLALEKRAFHPR